MRFSTTNVGDHDIEMSFYFRFFLPNIFIVTRKEGEKKVRISNMKKNPRTSYSRYMVKKSTHPLSNAWSLLLVHI